MTKNTLAVALAELIRDYRSSNQPGPDQDLNLSAERLRTIRLIGATADMFGGFESMQKLYGNVEDIDSRAASALDHLWDRVGSWVM